MEKNLTAFLPLKGSDTMEELMPEVLQAVAGEDYTIYAYFNDGTVHCFDIRPLINSSSDSVFAPLADVKAFAEKLTVMNGTAAWNLSGNRDPSKCIDLDPFTLYESPVVTDPLEQ